MEAGRRLWNRGLATAGVLLLLPLPVMPAPPGDAVPPRLRIRVKDHVGRESLRVAVLGAASRMARPECRQVFADFADAAGRPLQRRLDELEQTPTEWLSGLTFAGVDASSFCQRGVMAFTEPGSHVVHVCPGFALDQRRDGRLAELVVIHELLHTLGLEENPPSSREITARVNERCGG